MNKNTPQTPPPNAPLGSVQIPGTNIWQAPPRPNPQGIAVDHGGKGNWVSVPKKGK